MSEFQRQEREQYRDGLIQVVKELQQNWAEAQKDIARLQEENTRLVDALELKSRRLDAEIALRKELEDILYDWCYGEYLGVNSLLVAACERIQYERKGPHAHRS